MITPSEPVGLGHHEGFQLEVAAALNALQAVQLTR
jgi:hypothetical protein